MNSMYIYQSLTSLICLKQIKKQAPQQFPGGKKPSTKGLRGERRPCSYYNWMQNRDVLDSILGLGPAPTHSVATSPPSIFPDPWPLLIYWMNFTHLLIYPFTGLALPWKGIYGLGWLGYLLPFISSCHCHRYLPHSTSNTGTVNSGVVYSSPKWQEFLSLGGFPGGSDSKESSCNAGVRGLTPELGRSPGGGHGNPLRIRALRTPMDRGAWRATAPGVTEESDTAEWLSSARLFGSLVVLLLLLGILSLSLTLLT